ncbi:SurA N-terminal domain-containing protein [Neptuniibacter caesariensis]|uniref:Periplasmic chaperone PpiD n=1 Tax=Neptuniibacter caesariensis TaxID=207954 RepID=A0A7U8GQV3_NEPCE|nr:SurA N-terminal domain-containing protein [Neptuniibacter caesariensis]EAR59548.1 peptidyl-prolyl cis-trans isomerase D, putative [Oceanospirillum sp. MED92] [Neptuniibacter caesariensis]
MLQSIRDNSQGIIAKIIVGLIAVTFALFGVESLVSLTGGSNAPATVNGEEVSQQELVQGMRLQRNQMLSQMGENADPGLLNDNLISSMVLEGLIEQKVLVQSAENQGLVFTDAMIDQLIVSTKDFQVDGKFDKVQFETVLRNAGLSPLSYRALVRKEKLTEQERIAYLLSAFTLSNELNEIATLQNQSRDTRYFTLAAEPERAAQTVSDDEVADYFAQNSGQYLSDEQVAIEYIVLDRADLEKDVEVTADEVSAAYQQMVDSYQAQELRQAAHIMVEISDEQEAAAAETKAKALLDRLNAGEDFAAVAQSDSDDPASAEMGGDLGVNEKGTFSAEFEDALYALEKGQISEPVQTEFGYHLIKLLDVVESEVPTFEEAKAGIERDLLNEKAELEFVAQLDTLKDVAFSSGDLVEPAETLGLEIQTSELFSRAGNEAPITSEPKVLSVTFDPSFLQEGVNSDPIELSSSKVVVLRILDHQLPRERSLDEVKEVITATLLEEKVAEALTTKADQFIAKLKQGEALESLASGSEVISKTDISRGSQDLPEQLREALFEMPKPAEGEASYAAVDLLDGSKAIVALEKVTENAADLNEEEQRYMGMLLNSRFGQQDYQDHSEQLKDKAEIERL